MNDESVAVGAKAIRGLLLDEDFDESSVDEYAELFARRVIEDCLLASVLFNPETVRQERRERAEVAEAGLAQAIELLRQLTVSVRAYGVLKDKVPMVALDALAALMQATNAADDFLAVSKKEET